MSFLFPLGWLFLGLTPIIIALYLRRIRRRDLTVPTLLFWQKALGEQSRRAFLGRLRQWLSLALQLLILLLIILALVRPISSGLPGRQHSTVLVIDTRARMQAVEPGGETRFAKAVAAARRHAAEARESAPIAILAAGAFPEVVAPFQGDHGQLGTTLNTLRPTDAAGELAPAIALARELLAARPGTHELVVISDGSDFPESLAPEERLAVGSSRENVAIARFATRPQVASPHTVDLLLSLAHYGSQPAEGSVEIWSEEALLDVKPFQLAPNERRTEIFPALPAKGEQSRRLSAKLQVKGDDALALDNTAYAVLPAAQPLRVLLVTQGNWFLEKVLPADPGVQFELLSPEAFRPEMSGAFDVVVYDGTGPNGPKALADLNTLKGNALFLKESPFGAGEALKEPLITEKDSAHPLLRWVEWGEVTFFKATQLNTPEMDGWQFRAPLQSFEHPLILTGEHGGQRIAAFAFDVGESDLPLRIAFPLLISNTLQWLAHGDAALPPTSLECGKSLPLKPGETFSLLPDDEATGAAPSAATVPPAPQHEPSKEHGGILQPLRNGFYAIRPLQPPEAEANALIAVNTFSEAESNLSRAPEKAASPLAAPGNVLEPFTTRPLWHWFALAAFVLLSLEWWLYHRRLTE